MSVRISNKRRLQQPFQTSWTEKHSALLAVSKLYDPKRQVLPRFSDLPVEPKESRRKATTLCFYNLIVMLLRARDNDIQNFAYIWLHKGNQNQFLKHPKIK